MDVLSRVWFLGILFYWFWLRKLRSLLSWKLQELVWGLSWFFVFFHSLTRLHLHDRSPCACFTLTDDTERQAEHGAIHPTRDRFHLPIATFKAINHNTARPIILLTALKHQQQVTSFPLTLQVHSKEQEGCMLINPLTVLYQIHHLSSNISGKVKEFWKKGPLVPRTVFNLRDNFQVVLLTFFKLVRF